MFTLVFASQMFFLVMYSISDAKWRVHPRCKVKGASQMVVIHPGCNLFLFIHTFTRQYDNRLKHFHPQSGAVAHKLSLEAENRSLRGEPITSQWVRLLTPMRRQSHKVLPNSHVRAENASTRSRHRWRTHNLLTPVWRCRSSRQQTPTLAENPRTPMHDRMLTA